jgi:hypothetical protein
MVDQRKTGARNLSHIGREPIGEQGEDRESAPGVGPQQVMTAALRVDGPVGSPLHLAEHVDEGARLRLH